MTISMHAHKLNNRYHPNPHHHKRFHNQPQTPQKAQKNTNVITK